MAKTQAFDICIIGGGITGAGILAHAVANGLKAVLIDKNDFASGTSSRSSKMIHGGLRYLKMMQFGLVREALMEREALLKMYPGIVRPLPFIMPAYNTADLNAKALVIRFYGNLAGASVMEKSRKLSSEEVLQMLPGYNGQGLKGGVLYWDGWTNDAMLTISTLKNCSDNGAVVLNYCKANQLLDNNNLQCTDVNSGNIFTINANVFVNASGVWTDDVLKSVTGKANGIMKPSKGVHVVVSNKRIPSDYVVIVKSANGDGRYVYSFPWEHNLTVLGTTDTDYTGSIDKIEITEADVDYVLQAFNKDFPSAKLTRADVVGVYAGLRPMLDDKSNSSYGRSREYQIWWSADNFLNIAGGKLTSFLSMGKHCMETVLKKFPCGKQGSLPSAVKIHAVEAVRKIEAENSEWTEPLFAGLETTGAEVVYHTRNLFAQHLADVLTRRTAVTYALQTFDKDAVRKVAVIMGRELGHGDRWVGNEVNEYFEHWKEYHPHFISKQ